MYVMTLYNGETISFTSRHELSVWISSASFEPFKTIEFVLPEDWKTDPVLLYK